MFVVGTAEAKFPMLRNVLRVSLMTFLEILCLVCVVTKARIGTNTVILEKPQGFYIK